MSSTSDGPGDGPGRLIPFPPGGDVTDRPVPLADIDRLIPPPSEIPTENPMERTIELPPVREPIGPESVLRAESTPAYSPTVEETGGGEEGGGEYEYEPRRTFMERIGDWLEYRIAQGYAGLEAEGPYREAVIEAKVARLKAESEREIALLEVHNKLRQAGIQAAADKKAARGKGDAAAMKTGSNTSGGSRGGFGGGRGGSGTGPAGGGRNTSGAGGGRGGAGSGADKGGRKDARSSATHSPAPAAKANEDKRRQERQRAKEQAPAGGGRDGTGGGRGGAGGSRDGAKGSGGASPSQDRATARQSARAERHAERGKAKDQRRAAEQAAGLKDRTKDREQARAERQRARDKDWADREARQEREQKDRAERGAARAARRQERKARREKAKAAGAGRTTLGKAVGDEAQRRFDKRRQAAEDARLAKDKAGEGKAESEKTEAKEESEKTKGTAGDGKTEGTGKPAPDFEDGKKAGGKDEAGGKEDKGSGDKTTEPGGPDKAEAEKEPGEPGTAETAEEESGSGDSKAGKPTGPEAPTTAAKSPESPSETPTTASAGTEPEEAEIVEEKPSGGSAETAGGEEPRLGKRSFGERVKDRLTRNKPPAEEGPRPPLWMEAEGERARSPLRPESDDDIVDADVIDDRPGQEPGQSAEPQDLHAPHPPKNGLEKDAAEADPAAAGQTPGSDTPAGNDGKPAKESEPTEESKPSGPDEVPGGKADPLADLTKAQLLGFLVPGHSRPPEPSRPVWNDTSTAPAGGGPGMEIPAQSAPPDTTPKETLSMGNTPAQAGSRSLPAKHQTDIKFNEYLVLMTNIALGALGDKETADEMIGRLLATAKALEEIAADLADDHNIDAEITSQISELSEALAEMTAQAARCSQECADAAEAAVHAAAGVARVYGQDMDAKQDAGLAHASAAAHHN
ncbi:hypothetical protein [Streptomyces sp. TLI_105]|uniref:hypothetical protein n=1 Tax=Streptomyces sp. TLI_105 TaxID=1881019 RepID=UPI0008991BC1|nr:hypothetical protein [Streptomyces sp. TLI_105]SEE61375.1 hypothetical protein SAMN05428939_8146 [Streptomyces sp. TLI_105]